MLRSIDIFTVAALPGLPEHAAQDLVKVMRLRTFRKGTALFVQDEEPREVYFIETGRVKWHKVTPEGTDQILQVATRGDGVGLAALMDGRPFTADATALEESTAWALAISDFTKVALRHPEIALQVMQLVGDAVHRLVEHAVSMQVRSAHGRVSAVLIRAAEQLENGQRVIPLTHLEIAQLGGMARETVSRVLADFQRRGAVRLTRSAVILLDSRRFGSSEPEVRYG